MNPAEEKPFRLDGRRYSSRTAELIRTAIYSGIKNDGVALFTLKTIEENKDLFTEIGFPCEIKGDRLVGVLPSKDADLRFPWSVIVMTVSNK